MNAPTNPTSPWATLKADWSARSRMAAEWLRDEPAVVDMGCGKMMLKALVPPSTRYIGVDITPRDSDTIVADLNTEQPPLLNAPAVSLLGVIEYIEKPAHLLRELRHYKKLVISYNHFGIQDIYWALHPKKRKVGWKHRYTRWTFEKMLREAGFTIQVRRTVQLSESLYLAT